LRARDGRGPPAMVSIFNKLSPVPRAARSDAAADPGLPPKLGHLENTHFPHPLPVQAAPDLAAASRASSKGAKSLGERQAPSVEGPLQHFTTQDLKGLVASRQLKAGPSPSGGQPQQYGSILEGGPDPVHKLFKLLKHPESSKGAITSKLGLHGNNSWQGATFVQQLLKYTLLLMGWEGSCPWQTLVQQLNSREGQLGCWVPKVGVVRGTAGFSLQQGKLNVGSSHGYMRLGTVVGPRKAAGQPIKAAKRTIYAHQVMCWAMHGPPPSEHCCMVRHLCGNPRCIRPTCLAWGDAAQNVRDRQHHAWLKKCKGAVGLGKRGRE
jgi:HNH endonuclease